MPPLHPLLFDVSQSTTCSTDKVNNLLDFINHADSTSSIVEKAQHDPHWPWFLIADIAPFDFQSTDDGFTDFTILDDVLNVLECCLFRIGNLWDKYLALNSSDVKSENLFNPCLYVSCLISYFKLCKDIFSTFSRNTNFLFNSSSTVAYDFEWTFL